MEPILLLCDLDRTVIPNGTQIESLTARPRLHQLAASHEVTLVYVSGRDKELLQQAITEYALPVPSYAIGDVGTSIYRVGQEGSWELLVAWEKHLAADWQGKRGPAMQELFADIPSMQLQQDRPAQQGVFKVSYYTDVDIDRDVVFAQVQQRADAAGVGVTLTWSVDEIKQVGLLDVLPASASKLSAIEFLQHHLNFSEERTVFAGDSGNDLPVLTSGKQAILVKNARPEIRREAEDSLDKQGLRSKLYVAKGDFLDMNGNYTAGVLEGVAHFFPEVKELLL